MTADFLGKEDHLISQDQTGDTVKEILNMVAGNTFCHLDDQSVFNLGIPEIIHHGEVLHQADDSDQDIFITLNTQEDILAFQIVIGT